MDFKGIFVSVVVTVYNGEEFIADFVEETSAVLQEHFRLHEIIIVENGSEDRTASIIADLQKRVKNVQMYCLPRWRSDQIALVAGLDNAVGDFIVMMDPMADPPQLIPNMLRKAIEKRAEIVYALPAERVVAEKLYDRVRSRFLNLIAFVNDIELPLATSTYRLFSRSVLNYMLAAHDRHRIIAVAEALSGYRYQTLLYDRAFRSKPKRRRLNIPVVSMALNLLLSASTRPLRLITVMALGVSGMTLLFACYVIASHMFVEPAARGWGPLSLFLSFLFFLMFIILAVMSEYIARITEMVSKRPLYHISRETQSSVMDYVRELNVEALNRPTIVPVTPSSPQRGSTVSDFRDDWSTQPRDWPGAESSHATEPVEEPAVEDGQKVEPKLAK